MPAHSGLEVFALVPSATPRRGAVDAVMIRAELRRIAVRCAPACNPARRSHGADGGHGARRRIAHMGA